MSEIKKYVETKEYIVTLYTENDLEDFYKDMESKGHSSPATPERSVACVDRRPISVNTHYILADWEAEELRQDPRVRKVSLHPRYLGITAGEFSTKTQTSSNWNKSSSGISSNMLNFALLRCTEGQNRSGWGSNGNNNQTGTVTLDGTGKNVDVVIVDGDKVVLNHPEYAAEADGSGGTRFVQYNWFQHNPAVTGGSAGNYLYTGTPSGHATHVSGSACGSTQGWARDANIYNIFYFAGAVNNLTFPFVMDYVREFHRTKPVNPATGRKNPTITNNSWGMSIFPGEWSFSDITAVTYRGTRYTPGGGTVYTGVSGVCSANERLAQLLGFENFGNRIVTSGLYDPPGGDIVSKPESWVTEGNQTYLTIFGVPDSEYEITVQGPCTINLINNIVAEAFSGIITLESAISIFEGNNPVPIDEFTQGPFTSVEGGAVETDIRESITLENDVLYTIKFNTDLDISSAGNPLIVVAMSLTIEDDRIQTPSATVTEISNVLLGASGLTGSTTPTTGNNDDGFWELVLPFNIEYLGNTYDRIFVGTNFYLTFGAGSEIYSNISVISPNLPKIMWGAADNSVQRIYHGIEYVTGNDTFSVTNSGSSSYLIGSSEDPPLNLIRGWTYTFNINASGHPFWIKTAQVTGTGSAYSTGVTNNGTENGTITFAVPLDAPDTLYYICQFHSAMTGTINITDADRKYRVRIEGNASTGGTLGSPGMLCEYTFYETSPAQIDLQLAQTNRKSSGGGFSTEQLNAWGFIASQRIPVRVDGLDADIERAIDEGILYVGAAGNGRWKHDVPGGPDWDNTFEMAVRYPSSVTQPYYYMRGSSPTANDNAIQGEFDLPNICVGSIDVTSADEKASYSDCGPGVDIYAPGTSIISSYDSGVSDPRGGGFLGKISGTSMASPQVCGVIACALEQNPHWNQEQAKAYIIGIAKQGQISATTGGPADSRDLQGAPNLYLYYRKDRPDSGVAIPKNNQNIRPQSGQAWPRPKIYRFG